MRHKPKLPYSGLTVVLSNPSRFDKQELLSGIAGHFFQTKCLDSKISRYACDIRLSSTKEEGLLNGTKGILLLGDRAFQEWTKGKYSDYNLNEQRGCPLITKYNIPTLCSYLPQDCLDIIDYESKLNPQEGIETIYTEDDEDEETVKKKGKTKRSNYSFWLERDTRKLLSKFHPSYHQYHIPYTSFERRIAPSSEEFCEFLRGIGRDDNLYLDIETSIDGGYNMYCVGVSTDTSPVYVAPIFKWDGSLFYSFDATARIFKEIARAMSQGCVITHNGFGFDLLVLAWRYHIPWGYNHYDTMIAMHRCFPEVEKSLGHGMSIWTDEEYHKDEACFHPRNMNDLIRLMEYNAKDVHAMRLIRRAITSYASRQPGLTESIAQGMETVYPYTLTSLAGMYFSEEERENIIKENDRLMNHYLRWLDMLKGKEYKNNVLPTSSKSCVNFFHEFLNYEVVGRSRNISKKTGKPLNTPSLNEKNMYKLKLRYPQNIMIDICIAYRRRKKESGMLGFNDWDVSRLPC